MKIEIKFNQERNYPYLAVWIGPCGIAGEIDINEIRQDDILVISKVDHWYTNSSKIWVQFLNGNREGYITETEKEYAPLPKGFKVEFEQD